MSDSQTMELVPQGERAVAKPDAPMRQPQVAEMLQAVLQKGLTSETVGVVREMAQLLREEKAAEAEKEFNRSFAKLQREMGDVKADKPVYDRAGKLMYAYCSYEEIHDRVRPHMLANGFASRFSQGMDDKGRIVVTCWIMHESGHSVSNNYTVRPDSKGPPGSNETKLDAGASTVAQREAFCDALNIIRRGRDSDAKMEGSPISPEKAKELRQRVLNVKGNETEFLKTAGVDSFEKIGTATLEVLEQLLAKKERLAMQKLETKK